MRKYVSVALASCLAVGLTAASWLLVRADAPKPGAADKPAADKPADKPSADKPSAEEPGSADLDLHDPAYDRYIDLKLLTRAWTQLDPAMLADAGLQLAEGERVLLRPRKGFTAAKVLELAARTAAEKGDKATLDRLAKAAEAHNNKELADQVASAAKLFGGHRAADPALSVSVEQMTPEAFALYKDVLERVKAARLSGNRAALDDIEKAAPEMKGLSDAQRKYLAKAVTEAAADLPKGGDSKDATALALDKLASASRGPKKNKGSPHVGSGQNPNPPNAQGPVLGVKVHWDYGAGGLVITYVDPSGLASNLPDGAYLEEGDVITQVGGIPTSPNKSLSFMLEQADQSGNRFIVVTDVNSGVDLTHPF